jgi:hypothetical protein
MERVAFIVDATGERIDCLLNPESLEVRRLAGVRTPGATAGALIGTGLADDPVLFTGGGRTELTVDLIFDVDLVDAASRLDDVRALTGRLWQLAENSAVERGSNRPPLVRFVWGKSWNTPGVIVAISERFDAFGATGMPRRSWLRLKLLRASEPSAGPAGGFNEELVAAERASIGASTPDAVQATGDGGSGDGYAGVRFDLLATSALGNPLRWRVLAEHNRIANPMNILPGTVLSVPRSGGAS